MIGRRRAGFTVLELVLTLGVAAVLFAAAAPAVAARLPALAADQAAARLAADVETTRLLAIVRNVRMRVHVELETARWGRSMEVDGAWVEDGEAVLPAGVRFDAAASTRVAGGRVSITFVPRGHTADNATIALAAGTVGRRVVVSGAGRVRIE